VCVCVSVRHVSPESAPLSSTLIDDWRFVTGDMDAGDLEAALQVELQAMGLPRFNLADLTRTISVHDRNPCHRSD